MDHSVDVALLAGCGLLLTAVLAVRLSREPAPAAEPPPRPDPPPPEPPPDDARADDRYPKPG